MKNYLSFLKLPLKYNILLTRDYQAILTESYEKLSQFLKISSKNKYKSQPEIIKQYSQRVKKN